MRMKVCNLSWMLIISSVFLGILVGWSATLASRVLPVIARLVLIFALLLDLYGRLRVIRSIFIPGALHGIEASFLADDSLRKLRSAIFRVVWSCRQPLANSLLFGPHGCGYRLLDSAADIGFQWDSRQLGWERLGVPVLSILAGPIQHFRGAVLEAWRNKVSADLSVRKGFRGGSWLDTDGSLQLLNSGHVRERDKGLLWVSMLVVFGIAFCSGRSRISMCRVVSAVVLMVMVIFSGIVLFPSG